MKKKIFNWEFGFKYRHVNIHMLSGFRGFSLGKEKNSKTSYILMISNTLGYRHVNIHMLSEFRGFSHGKDKISKTSYILMISNTLCYYRHEHPHVIRI